MVTSPLPPNVPLSVSVLIVEVAAIVSALETESVPPQVKLLITASAPDNVTVNPAPIQTSSIGRGTTLVLQFPAVCQRPFSARPVHLAEHTSMPARADRGGSR